MKKILLLVPLIFLWLFLFPVYRERVPAFGCFDDCFNYLGGYFILTGQRLYSQIFFNHQPLPAYISAAIQYVGKPDSLYALVYQHRLAVLALGFVFDSLLTLRFGLVGLGFAFLYETTKGFIFGERFLAEAMIVYPMVYLFGLVFESFKGKKLSPVDFSLASVFSWFIIFSREPYIPLALFLWGILVWRQKRYRRLAFLIFGLVAAVTILLHSPQDFFFNLVTVNLQSVAAAEIQNEKLLGLGLVRVFLYPVFLWFGGSWNLFRIVEAGLVAITALTALFLVRRRWGRTLLLISFLTLALANLRPAQPGQLYYAAFHHLQWYGILIMLTMLSLRETWFLKHKAAAVIGTAGFTVLLLLATTSKESYLYDRVDRNAEFTANYGLYYVTGGVVRALSDPTDTLFLDGWDDLIYWQAQRRSPYAYAWYTSVMPQFAKFREARLAMFERTPPDFYYGKCEKDQLTSVLPDSVQNDYLRFFWKGRPTCLFVNKLMLKRIPHERLEVVSKQFDYQLKL